MYTYKFIKYVELREYFRAVSRICCKFEVKFLYTMRVIYLPRWNFLPKNFMKFVIFQKNRHTAAFLDLLGQLSKSYMTSISGILSK
jgi:hypothetical protein